MLALRKLKSQSMTRFFTTLIVVLVVSTTAFSQTKGTNEFGVNIGYNAAHSCGKQ
jgi:hypothetical protein